MFIVITTKDNDGVIETEVSKVFLTHEIAQNFLVGKLAIEENKLTKKFGDEIEYFERDDGEGMITNDGNTRVYVEIKKTELLDRI